MQQRITPVFILLSAGLAGCASLDKGECQTGDWASIGYQDGARASDKNLLFGNHVKACSKHDVVPDENTYSQGYENGLRNAYCTYDTGVSVGGVPQRYNEACPQDVEKKFLEGYIYGLGESELDLKNELAENNQHLAGLKSIQSKHQIAVELYQRDLNFEKVDEYKKKLDDGRGEITLTNSNIRSIKKKINDVKIWRGQWQ